MMRRPTSLPLILATLVVGIGLGWTLRDRVFTGFDQVPVAVAPTASMAPIVTSTDAATPLPDPLLPPSVTATLVSPVPTMPATATSLRSTATATAFLSVPTATLVPVSQISGYQAYRVQPGDTLAAIAAAGGSDPDLLRRYNRLADAPVSGRPLIVPQLADRSVSLAGAPIMPVRGNSDRPYVAFTLDAGGGSEPVPQILETLRRYEVRITFFVTGAWVRDNPELLRRMVADGHEIANHSNTHPDFRSLDAAQIAAELAATEASIREIAGVSSRPLFRPPYGGQDTRVLQAVIAQGYLPIYWTVDVLDSVGEPKTPEFIYERATAVLSVAELRGAIILAHCASPATAAALPAILERFAELGLEVRPVSEVL
jgi:peptidoglycan-N-acetylmuramic acid deacetylase